MGSSDVNSASLLTASSPRDADDAEVGSQKGTGQEEETPEVLQGNLPDLGPDSVPEPLVVPEFGERPLRKKGETATPVTSVQPEAPDTLLVALKGASIVDEHRALMGAVIKKIQSTESGLNES